MIGSKTATWLLIGAFFAFQQIPQATAQVGAPEKIDMPVPAKWRAPFAQFLTDFGVDDVEATVEASRVGLYDEAMGGRPELIVFRVVHKLACTPDRDRCLTVIGHIDHDKLIADLMFFAGDMVTRGDTIDQMLGIQMWPSILFFSRDTIVAVRNTVMGLLVSEGPRPPDDR